MKSICFFNHYHNGDLFHSKGFVKDIISSIDTKFYYAHSMSPIVLSDLNVEHINSPNISIFTKFENTDDTVYVNTWIGCYDNPDKCACTLNFNYKIYGEIYEYLNKCFSSNLKLKSIENYFPSIDYSKFNCSNVDFFVESAPQQKVLFCNGPCLSGQSSYTGDMSTIIESCAIKFPEKVFIATYKFATQLKNIKFTDDIIRLNKCDLNEISYLSKFCDLIVGRNSGPFCFCTVDENINNPKKIFYAFGERETHCFYHDVDIKSTFIFENTDDLNVVEISLLELIEKI